MAKRALDSTPYRPLLDSHLVSAALARTVDTSVSEEGGSVESTVSVGERPRESAKSEPRSPNLRVESSVVPEQTKASSVTAPAPIFEKFDQEKRILFTRSENQALDRLVLALACRLNAQVKTSHIIRAIVGLLLHAEDEIDRRAGQHGPLVRPPNGDPKALQRFERELGSIILSALRDAGPIRAE